jgi:hypothetical protein
MHAISILKYVVIAGEGSSREGKHHFDYGFVEVLTFDK